MLKLLIPLIVGILGLVVFGGGQTFMPIFEWLWTADWFPGEIKLTQEEIHQIFAIANATPGVIGTKFASFTGYLLFNELYWQFLSMFVVFVFFAIPTILVVTFAFKFISKSNDENIYLTNIVKWLKPIIIGILVALMIKFLVNSFFPQLSFNNIIPKKNNNSDENGNSFWNLKWRKSILYFWIPIAFIESYYLFFIKKVNFVFLIIGHIAGAYILFAAWL
ncbi:MAG: hypothetical protein E7Y34_00300 [Mycoplasma sp.]|nr:hypothetical protein [Mycoplasma sp.]